MFEIVINVIYIYVWYEFGEKRYTLIKWREVVIDNLRYITRKKCYFLHNIYLNDGAV